MLQPVIAHHVQLSRLATDGAELPSRGASRTHLPELEYVRGASRFECEALRSVEYLEVAALNQIQYVAHRLHVGLGRAIQRRPKVRRVDRRLEDFERRLFQVLERGFQGRTQPEPLVVLGCARQERAHFILLTETFHQIRMRTELHTPLHIGIFRLESEGPDCPTQHSVGRLNGRQSGSIYSCVNDFTFTKMQTPDLRRMNHKGPVLTRRAEKLHQVRQRDLLGAWSRVSASRGPAADGKPDGSP